MQVKIVLTLIVSLILLVALLVLLVVQVMNMYSDDKNCAENDSFEKPEGNPNRSRTERDPLDDLSPGG